MASATIALWVPVASASAAPSLRNVNGTSTGQAGYFVLTAPASASSGDTFTVPTLTCSGTSFRGVAAGALIFAATSGVPTGAGVLLLCSGATAAYQGELVINGAGTATTFTPKAGDVITVSTSESATSAKATIKDVTQAKSKSLSSTTGATNGSVLVGIDSLSNNGTQLPVPKFATIKFTNGKEDGKTVKLAGGKPFNMQTSGGVLQILTGALGTTGNNWSETFKHS
jgi:hypothetical protein